MFKRVIVFTLLFVLLFPVGARANDGGGWLDTHNYLATKVRVDKRKGGIGDEIKVSIICTNNTSSPIEIMGIFNLFENTFEFDEYYNENNHASLYKAIYDKEIDSGKMVEIEISMKIPENIDCYVKNNRYYADIDVFMEYSVKLDDWNYEEYFVPKSKPIPIEITNIKDGSDIIELDVLEDTSVFNFPAIVNKAEVHFSDTYYLHSSLVNEVVITNKGDIEIKDIRTVDSNNQEIIHSIAPSESITRRFIFYRHILDKKIPKILQTDYKVFFSHNDEYYLVNKRKEYPCIIIYPPDIDVKLIDLNEKNKSNGYDYSDSINTVAVTNLSDAPLSNIYFSFTDDFYYDKNKIIPYLSPYQTIYLPNITEADLRYWSYYIGYIFENNNLYFWRLYADFSRDDHSDISEVEYDSYIRMSHSIPSKLKSLSDKPTPTPIPTITPSLFPIENLTPTQIPAPTATTPPIEITSVKKQSAIPYWVWVVLCFAIIGAGVLVYVFRKKSLNKKEDISS